MFDIQMAIRSSSLFFGVHSRTTRHESALSFSTFDLYKAERFFGGIRMT
jgi:hypothetical protein